VEEHPDWPLEKATTYHRLPELRLGCTPDFKINDGLLAPRFAPSQRAWLLQGTLVPVNPAAPASTGRDGDDR
jgi:hypothetical protein